MQNEYWVYMLANKSNSVLYTGFTNNLKRRVEEHKTKQVEGFTNKYNCNKLVWYQLFTTAAEAKKQEKRVKKWLRQWKNELVEKENPSWIDLAADWYN